MVDKGSKADGGPPAWKALLSDSANVTTLYGRLELAKPAIAQVQAILDEYAGQPPGSQKLFVALGIGALNTSLSALDADSVVTCRQLLAVNDVLAGSDPRLAVVLVEQQFINSLVRLHQRVGNLSDCVSQTILLLLCTTTLLAGAGAGSLEPVASKPELIELLISHLVFLSLNPSVLLSPAGLGTSQRCVQVCWELTRAGSPHCQAFRELLQRIDIAGRLIMIAATALGRDGGAAAAAAADVSSGSTGGAPPPQAAAASTAEGQAAVSGMAALEDRRAAAAASAASSDGSASGSGSGSAPSPAAPTMTIGPSNGDSCRGDSDLYEERLALGAQATSFVANLAGLGIRGIELSSAGLAPHRAWLLRPGTLAALRAPLEGLVDGLAELRRRMQEEVGGEEEAAGPGMNGAGLEGEEADLRPGRVPRRRLLDQVEGAVRNLLFLLGLPTIVMGSNEEDVVEGCGFVIRHSFGLYTEGYVDITRALRAAIADPTGPTTTTTTCSGPTTSAFKGPYPGDYGPFFRAYAGHIETVATALGVQLEDWGVRFTGEQAVRDLPVMQVGEGVDARIAQSWLKGQIQDIINWGHAMMHVVRMADQAKMAAKPNPAAQRQQQLGAQAFPKPAAPHAYRPAAADAAAAAGAVEIAATPAAGGACCAGCGGAPPAGGPPFQSCSKCRGVRYCSRACQVGHWPQHKAECKAAAAAPAPAAAAAAAAAAPATGETAAAAAAAPVTGETAAGAAAEASEPVGAVATPAEDAPAVAPTAAESGAGAAGGEAACKQEATEAA